MTRVRGQPPSMTGVGVAAAAVAGFAAADVVAVVVVVPGFADVCGVAGFAGVLGAAGFVVVVVVCARSTSRKGGETSDTIAAIAATRL